MLKSALSALACAFALGFTPACKSCIDRESRSAAAPGREQQTDLAQLRARLAARRLDRSKTYPAGTDGSTACGTDVDCFLIQGERCAKAEVTHADSYSAYGLTQRIEARYRIVGKADDKCKLIRDTLNLSAKVDEKWSRALQKKGIAADEIEQTRIDALETLREGNPTHVECMLTSDQVLEIGLNLAEGRYDPQFLRMLCTEVDAPQPKP
jgi:hypothetical protein